VAAAWAALTWLAGRRRPRVHERHVREQHWNSQTRGRGLRMSEPLRDRLRPRWLQLRRDD
jgi:hypothetical protein